jgi:hypothetical protein
LPLLLRPNGLRNTHRGLLTRWNHENLRVRKVAVKFWTNNSCCQASPEKAVFWCAISAGPPAWPSASRAHMVGANAPCPSGTTATRGSGRLLCKRSCRQRQGSAREHGRRPRCRLSRCDTAFFALGSVFVRRRLPECRGPAAGSAQLSIERSFLRAWAKARPNRKNSYGA